MVNVFFRDVFLRAMSTVLIVLFYLQLIDFEQFMQLFISQYAVLSLGLAVYLMAIGRFNLKVDKDFLALPLKRN